MRYKNLVCPLVVFCAAGLISTSAWLLTPDDLAFAAGIKAPAMLGHVLFAAISSVVVFGLGSLLAIAMPSRPDLFVNDSAASLVAWFKRLTLLALVCFIAIVGLTLAQSGNANVLLDTMSGRTRFAAIEGLTTFVHATTAAAVLLVAAIVRFGWAPLVRATRNLSTWVFLLVALIVARAFLGSERIAIYLPLIAALAIGMVRSSNRAGIKAIILAGVIVTSVAGLFVGSEYFRSYGVKRTDYSLDETLWSYGLNRLLLYYGISVNTGGAMLEAVSEGHGYEPIFKTTFNPARKVLDFVSGGEDPTSSLAEMIEWSGFYNPEFNNVWGFASPFTEGAFIGLLYWGLWGFVATRLWRRARTSDADVLTLAMFGLVIAGLVEAARVNALGTVHVLVPLALLFVVRSISGANVVDARGLGDGSIRYTV
jgi:hypothetical protein